MKVLFMPQAGALGIGGITRCLAVAEEMLACGHRVGFFCRADILAMLQQLPVEDIYRAPIPTRPETSRVPPFRLVDSIKIRGMHIPTYVRETVDAECFAIQSFRPDVVFTENQFTAAISTALAGVPLVSTAASVNHPDFRSPLYPLPKPSKDVTDAFNTVLSEYNLPEISDVFELVNGRSALNVAPTMSQLEPDISKFPRVHFVGPLLYRRMELASLPNALTENGSAPLVYVYMSSGTLTPSMYVPVLLETFRYLNVRVACALREKTYEGQALPLLIGNLYLSEYLPGLSMALKSSMVITRGGQNTMMTCLLAGTPVAGFPGTNAEADFNVRGLRELGASMHGTDEDFNPSFLKSAFKEFTKNDHYRSRARALGEKIRTLGGSHKVVRLMEALC